MPQDADRGRPLRTERSRTFVAQVFVCAALCSSPSLAQDISQLDGRELYDLACASCHGETGSGVDPSRTAFDTPLPDFTDCSFTSREPVADWVAVAHSGGPVRGFDETMPAFGEALNEEQLTMVVEYVRGFCTNRRWPRGELNLPRPLITEKAYPEDEAVSTISVAAEGPGAVINELLYERRFGPENQIEVKVPFGVREAPGASGGWNPGIGDIAVGFKRAMFHNDQSILSLGGEVVLPTGSEDDGFGGGTPVLESFVAFGQVLPSDAFLHVQGILEFPTEGGRENEAVWRLVLGKSFTQGQFGRTWSPMVEVLGATELADGATVAWDVVPQMQVTLNTRQHVMFNIGARIPVNDASLRSTQILFYVLWDWFDGGFFDGW